MKTIILLAVTIFISLQFVCNVSCNITVNLSAANRIVNGKAAKIADFPYQLSLRRNTVHMCGASVLSTQWAITAAHCIHGYDKSPTMFSLRAGSNMRLTGGTVIYISTIFEHPSYNADTMNYDVALLRTKPNILRGDFITPIKLPNTNDIIPPNTEAIVSGWGHMSSSENVLSKDLKYTVVNIYNQELCNESLKSQGGITDAMFCAAARNTDACQGDSGGPIQINGTLVGVVSWGVGCADPYYPGVYTRLTHAGIRLWVRVITHL